MLVVRHAHSLRSDGEPVQSNRAGHGMVQGHRCERVRQEARLISLLEIAYACEGAPEASLAGPSPHGLVVVALLLLLVLHFSTTSPVLRCSGCGSGINFDLIPREDAITLRLPKSRSVKRGPGYYFLFTHVCMFSFSTSLNCII